MEKERLDLMVEFVTEFVFDSEHNPANALFNIVYCRNLKLAYVLIKTFFKVRSEL